MKKIYDLAVKTGSYEKDGETKNKYLNVGAVMEKEDGNQFILLDRTFNPAGLPNPENRSNVIVSMFKKQADGTNAEYQKKADDGDIPF